MFKEVRLNDVVDPEVGPDVTLAQLQARVAQASAPLPPLLERAWVDGAELDGQRGARGQGLYTLRFMNFNVLAEGLSSGGPALIPPFPTDLRGKRVKASAYGGFDKVPEPHNVLDWGRVRRWRLLQEILSVNPDVLAIQECDNFANFFEPALAKAGYQGAFAPKQDSPGMMFGFYSDGVALFWKRAELSLVAGVGGRVPLHVVQRPSPHLVATLRHKPSGRALVVACTHLKAKTGAANEFKRDRQIAIVLELVGAAADAIAEADAADAAVLAILAEPAERGVGCTGCFGFGKHNKVAQRPRADESPGASTPKPAASSTEPLVAVLGDFNSDAYAEEEPTPAVKADAKDGQSVGGSSSASLESAWSTSTAGQGFGSDKPVALAVPRVTAWRRGLLASAYPLATSLAACELCQWNLRRGGAWSTWKLRGSFEARHQIDYIFVSQARNATSGNGSAGKPKSGAPAAVAGNSRVVQVLAPPQDSDVPRARLPCAAYPSDHLSIAADVAFD